MCIFVCLPRVEHIYIKYILGTYMISNVKETLIIELIEECDMN